MRGYTLKRRHGLTLDRHQEIGRKLKVFRRFTLALLQELGNAYPYASRQAKACERMERTISRLKCILDDVVFRENPGAEKGAMGRIYYGDSRLSPEELKI